VWKWIARINFQFRWIAHCWEWAFGCMFGTILEAD
jgi:hypothetical protein